MAFGLGATAVLMSTLAGLQIRGEPEKPTRVFRTVFAPDIISLDGKLDETANVAFAAGEIIRECGFSEFQANLGDLHGLTYELEISHDNLRELQCVETRVPTIDRGIELGFRVD